MWWVPQAVSFGGNAREKSAGAVSQTHQTRPDTHSPLSLTTLTLLLSLFISLYFRFTITFFLLFISSRSIYIITFLISEKETCGTQRLQKHLAVKSNAILFPIWQPRQISLRTMKKHQLGVWLITYLLFIYKSIYLCEKWYVVYL